MKGSSIYAGMYIHFAYDYHRPALPPSVSVCPLCYRCRRITDNRGTTSLRVQSIGVGWCVYVATLWQFRFLIKQWAWIVTRNVGAAFQASAGVDLQRIDFASICILYLQSRTYWLVTAKVIISG